MQYCLYSVSRTGFGTALGGLGSSGLPDPFTSPPPRKEGEAHKPVEVKSPSHQLNYFSVFKSDSEEEEEGEERPSAAHTQDTTGGEAQDMGDRHLSDSPAKSSGVRQIFSDITGSPKPPTPQPDTAADEEDKWDSSEEEEEGEKDEAGQEVPKGIGLQQEGTDEEEEEEEESEWEIEQQASRQSLSPSLAKSPLPDLPSVTRLSPLPPLQPRGTSPPAVQSAGKLTGLHDQGAGKHISFSKEAGSRPDTELAGRAPSYPGVSPGTERQKMDVEASDRLHSKQSELLRALQMRRERVDVTQSSPDTRKPVAMETDRPTPRSASVTVSQMKSMWEGQGDKGHSHPQLTASKSEPEVKSDSPPVEQPPQSIPESGGRQKDLPSSHAPKMADSRGTSLTPDTPLNAPSKSVPQSVMPAQPTSPPTLTPNTVAQTNSTHVAAQLPSNDQSHERGRVQPTSDSEDVSVLGGKQESSAGTMSSEEEEDGVGAVVPTTAAERGLPLSLKDLQAEVSPLRVEPNPARRQPVSPIHSAVRYTLDTDTQDLSPDNTTDDFSVSDKVCVGVGGGAGVVVCLEYCMFDCSPCHFCAGAAATASSGVQQRWGGGCVPWNP